MDGLFSRKVVDKNILLIKDNVVDDFYQKTLDLLGKGNGWYMEESGGPLTRELDKFLLPSIFVCYERYGDNV